ncbi:MAG: AzlD domain-containing protein [Anaerolineae bacterium]|nr:AzlD domain-containing protein [Anaerolineae bacterium]
MDQKVVLLTILGMQIVTYVPRVLPVLLFSSRQLPPLVIAWLRHVPVAVLAAMLLPSLLLVEQRIHFAPGNLFLWAAVPTLFVAWKTQSLFGSVLCGMVIVAVARFFGVA